MRQRSLSSWLTLLSVTLGVGLAIAIMVFQREGEALFSQSDFGYDIIVGPKASPLQIVLNTVYHLDVSPGNIPYSIYEQLSAPNHPLVRNAIPYAVGDEFQGHRIVGTIDRAFPIDYQGKLLNRPLQYRKDRSFEFAEGRPFHPQKFEAVIGSDVALRTGLKLGSKFKAQHDAGSSAVEKEEHDEQWEVVGILKPTKTANDRIIFIPIVSFFAIPKHEEYLEKLEEFQKQMDAMNAGTTRPTPAPKPTKSSSTGELLADAPEKKDPAHHNHEEAYDLNPDGAINLHLEKEKWKVSAILVETRRGGFQNQMLIYQFKNRTDAMAVNPAMEMRNFFETFFKGSSTLLLVISLLVTIVAAVSILVSIYNSVMARLREIAILRALGATRARVLALICIEAALIGLAGGILGLIVGHLLAFGGSLFMNHLIGQEIHWLATGSREWIYLAVVVALAVLAGLVPALRAYKTPVATHLMAV
ncbi:MAG TPA: FtsX-like permease family protein [Tepidisphaeraceae bacterium]|nr:FtsX-like permease family protein [Tepidisphaeraceae bacterium]